LFKCVNLYADDLNHSLLFLYKKIWRCPTISKELAINEEIRDKEIRVISDNGEQLGLMSSKEAQTIANSKNLDLVMISPNANPPVCKIMDYGKYKYEQSRKEKESKKKQKVLEIKEIRVTPNIEEHDFNFKSKNAKKFLEDGNKVRITVKFRGREVNNVKAGEVVLEKFIEELQDVAQVEKKPKLEGKNMFIILAANANK
jgi:translation initiation factor IF-3